MIPWREKLHSCIAATRDRMKERSHFLPAAKPAGQWIIFGFFLSFFFRKICQIQPFRGQRGTETWVIEATDSKYEVISDL